MAEKLSVVIITLNEEKNIDRCLDAAWQVADEIVVVDSYSTDKTKKICLERGVKFIEHTFEGYGLQKNFAITQANCNYILSLDADEVLSDTLVQSINQVKQKPTFKAYQINRMSFYVDKFIKHGHWFPDKKIRLFHKEYCQWTTDEVHEIIEPQNGVAISILKGVLFHYTFTSISDHLRQANNFSDLGARQLSYKSSFFLLTKAFISPVWGFFYGYILKLGFLDGWHGISIAVISSAETFLKYAKAHFHRYKLPAGQIRLLHMSSLMTWRGGEQQVAALVTSLADNNVNNYLVVSKGSELEMFCKKNNMQYTSIRFGNGFNLLAAWHLKRICQQLQIDVVHMHCSPSHTLAIFSNLLGNKAKLILSRRVIFPIRQNTLSLQKFNYPAIERIICVSKSVRSILQRDIKREDVFDVVYDGVDINSITTRKSNGSIRKELHLQDKTIVAIIAALSPEKDHKTFLEAAKILNDQQQNFHFLIVGAGNEESKIKNLVRKYSLENAVTLTGFRTDIPDILQDIDYFVLTSIEEGLGSSIIEAFANKVPVIATNVGGIPELVIHDKTGLLVEPQQAQEIAYQINNLINNRTLRETIVEGAWQYMHQNFRIENTAKKTTDIYREVVFKTVSN
jgi:L-malate glycosyltransferase